VIVPSALAGPGVPVRLRGFGPAQVTAGTDQGSAIDRLSQSLQTTNPGYNQSYNQGYNPGYNTNEYWGYGGYIDPSGNYGLRFPGRPGYYPNGYPYERYGYDPYYNPPSGTVSGGMYWPGPSPGRPPVYYRPRPYVRPRH